MKVRTVFVSVIAILMLMFAAVVDAQDVDPCLGLNESDCQLINTATLNTLASAQSFNQNWTINFSVTGSPTGEDVIFNATGSGPVVLDMAAMDGIPLTFQQMIDVEFSDMGSMQSASLVATLSDGIFYFDLGDGNVQGINLMEAMDAAESGGMGLPIDPSEIMEDPTSALGEDVDMEALMTLGEDLGALAAIPGFLNYNRDGAVYTFTADIGTLISNPDFSNALMQIGEATGQSDVASMGMLLPMLLDNGVITVRQTVDEANMLVTGLNFRLDGTVNAGALTGETEMPPIVIVLDFNVELSDLNGNFSIVAPENATLIPLN